MKEKFIGNFLFLIFANVLVKPFYVFGIDMKIQDTVGAENYGLYFILFNFSFLFFIILDLGLTQYNTRIVAQNPKVLSSTLSNFILAKLFLGLVFLLSIFFGGILLGFNSIEFLFLGGIGIIHFLNSLIEYLRSNIAALQLFKTDAILSIINRLLLIFFCGILLYGNIIPEFKIEYFIELQIFTLLITAIICFIIVLKKGKTIRFSFDKKIIYSIIKEGYPYALLVVLTTIYTRTDAIMLKELLPNEGKTEAGYYAAAYRFLDMAAMFGLLMASQLLPLFAKLIQEKNKEKIRNLVKTAFKIIMFISISIAVLLGNVGEEIIAFIFEEYPSAYVGLILTWLIFSFIPIASSYVFNTLMNANANLKTLNVIGLIGVIFNIVLNIFLIPEYKALGAVWATIFTQGAVALAHIYYCNKKLDLGLSLKIFFQAMLFGLLMWALVKLALPHLTVNWMWQIIMGGIISLPLAIILGLLQPSMIKEIKG